MLSFEINMNMKIMQRVGYTTFDFLSDIGGVTSILYTFIRALLGAWTYNYFDRYMISQLYDTTRRDEDDDVDKAE